MKVNKVLKDFILFTIIPFIIPFIIDIPDMLMDISIKWTIIFFIAGIDFYFSYKSLLEKKRDNNKEYIQKSIRHAFSGAHEIIERKCDVLSHETEVNRINLKDNVLPYDIHSQIGDICKEFKKVMSSITQINNEFISVTFIYRYVYNGCSQNDNQWK